MNGIERMRAALAFHDADHTAVNPEIIQHALEITHTKHSIYSTNGGVLADTQIACQKYYDYDSVYISSDNYIICEALGGQVRFPEDAPPQLARTALVNGDVGSLKKLTADSGRVPVILRATEIARKRVGEEVFIKTCIDSAPFSAAACIAGPENLLMAVADEEQWVTELMDYCSEQIVSFGCLAAEAGAHALAFGDSVSSLLSRAMYEETAFPYAKKTITALKKKTGLPVFYHVCGDTNRMLDLILSTGADCVELDSMVDFANAKELAAGRCCLEGNVSTIEALLEGRPEDVRREADYVLDLFPKEKGGLILSGACEIPRFTPEENIRELVRTTRRKSN